MNNHYKNKYDKYLEKIKLLDRNSLICFITYQPNNYFLDFMNSLAKKTNIYCIVDDSDFKCPKNDVIFIQISENKCKPYSPTYDPIFIKRRLKGRCGGWSKALYYFSNLAQSFENIWFIEEDVYFRDLNTIMKINDKYRKVDLLIPSMMNRDSNWSHWPKGAELKSFKSAIKSVINGFGESGETAELQLYHSMHCAVRISKNILKLLKRISEKEGRLYFLEYLLPSLAKSANLTVYNPIELSGIKWSYDWSEELLQTGYLYHPVKDYTLQKKWRENKDKLDLIDDLGRNVHSGDSNGGSQSAGRKNKLLIGYKNKKECEKVFDGNWENIKKTNSVYPKFNQMIYTAGDKDQVNKRVFLKLMSELSHFQKFMGEKKTIELETRIFLLRKTFNYMFEELKKGIIVVIRNNKLQMFLPFSNANYKNNWYDKLAVDKQDKKELDELKTLEKKMKWLNSSTKLYKSYQRQHFELRKKNAERFRKLMPKYGFDPKRTNMFRQQWYANNCLLRSEYPSYEGDKLYNIYLDIFSNLTQKTKVPDCEFILNIRDFPVLRKEDDAGIRHHPYNYLSNDALEERWQGKHALILGYASADGFEDIPICTPDDWEISTSKIFPVKCGDQYSNLTKMKLTKWADKKTRATFYGSATGCGVTPDTNIRLKAAQLSHFNPELIDANITNWNSRVRICGVFNGDCEAGDAGRTFIKIKPNDFEFKLTNTKQTLEEKGGFKYILHLDGHVSANRFLSELGLGSALLFPDDSKYKMWTRDFVKEGIHYIKIENDLSNLIKIMKDASKPVNDKKAEKIAVNARKLFLQLTDTEFQLNYITKKIKEGISEKFTKSAGAGIKKNKSIGLITIFRAKGETELYRKKQLDTFVKIMPGLMNRVAKEYKIYIIEQMDDKPFNIGALKNIGFILSEEKHDYYIFTDVDAIPDDELLKYYAGEFSPILLAAKGNRYGDSVSMPMCVGFTKEHFKSVNGYPMNFFGWGGEDDSLAIRMNIAGLKKKFIPKYGRIIDLETDNNKEQLEYDEKKKNIAEKEMSKWEKLSNTSNDWETNGIVGDFPYKVLREGMIGANIMHYGVKLMYESVGTEGLTKENTDNLYKDMIVLEEDYV